MLETLQIAAVILVVLAVAPALAHALELPGKMRLSRDTYAAVQPIYYPGFTIGGGIGEAGGLLLTLFLVLVTPVGTRDFWLAVVALLGFLGMQAVYWLVTHPVNRFWLEGEALGNLGSRFFSFASRRGAGPEGDWTHLRNRWEYSHVARAALSAVSLIALVLALS